MSLATTYYLLKTMPQHDEKRTLPYSADQVFDLVAAIERYPEFLPWCKGARILTRTDRSVTADLIIGYKMFQEKFTSLVTLDRPHGIAVQYQAGPLSRLANEWTFNAKGPASCEIGFHVSFDIRSPVMRAVMDLFFDKALRKMVAAFEARARQLYG